MKNHHRNSKQLHISNNDREDRRRLASPPFGHESRGEPYQERSTPSSAVFRNFTCGTHMHVVQLRVKWRSDGLNKRSERCPPLIRAPRVFVVLPVSIVVAQQSGRRGRDSRSGSSRSRRVSAVNNRCPPS